MKNFEAIHDFGDEWRGSENFEVSEVGHYLFSAWVTYKSPEYGTQRESCIVHIFRNGMQDGEIDIHSSGELQNETHHLGFSPKWQKYKFSKDDGAFVVLGASPKMGGEYTVRIIPNSKKASFR
ncbi:hypothetical protein [Denitromonas halophila]|uniref:Uncharacterized protein n=1 Tax=Denitromonas halophila TaxID=1629404 RepID=A0A557QID0_9RHOO|nr:hypothetical protein [Denitromonas halophila]TVO52668.1 hypothetical protein FHP91_17180 [Denitromonas halophila]